VLKILKLILLLFFIVSCSLNPNSKLWTKKNEIKKDKILKIRKINTKEKILKNELNTSLKINIKNAKDENSYLQNFNNNNGKSNYDGKLRSISKYKFSKIENFYQYEPEIAVDKNNIIFFDNKGSLLKFNKNSKLIWKKNYYSKAEKKLNPILFFSNNAKYLVVADTIAKYYVMDIESGNLIWSKNNTSPFNSQIKIFRDKFYVVDSENILRCFSLKNGKQIWKFKTDKPFIKSQKKHSLVIKDNKIIFNNTLGDISAVDINNGNLMWQTPTQNKDILSESMFLKISDLIVGDNAILFSNNDNGFFSIDTDSGIMNWKQKINSNLRPTLVDNLIFTVTNEGYFVVIENETGNLIRSTNIFKNIKSKKRQKIKPIGFIVGKKNIYLTTSNGRLFVVDILTGTTKSILKIDNEKISRPIVLGQNLFIVKDNSVIKLN
jgi:outer membrane protein assembly factor BamB